MGEENQKVRNIIIMDSLYNKISSDDITLEICFRILDMQRQVGKLFLYVLHLTA